MSEAEDHAANLYLWVLRFEADPERSKHDMDELRAAADFITRQQAELELLKPSRPFEINYYYDSKYLHG